MEDAAKETISYVEIMAFYPSIFVQTGFPDRVKREAELQRYVDWNNSPSNIQYFEKRKFVEGPSVFTQFTKSERDLCRRLSTIVGKMTKEKFGREARPISALLAQFGIFRSIMYLQSAISSPLRVFEIGPGNGYLGGLLLLAGLRYGCFDNAQSFYLWQNRLFSAIANEFADWALEEQFDDCDTNEPYHIPWWHFLKLRKKCHLEADVVVSNTNLGEMSYDALVYCAKIAKQILSKSNLGVFLFTNIGDPKHNNLCTVQSVLEACGFRKICEKKIFAFVISEKTNLERIRQLGREIPLYGSTLCTERFSAAEALAIQPFSLPNDLDFLSYIGTFQLPSSVLQSKPEDLPSILQTGGGSRTH